MTLEERLVAQLQRGLPRRLARRTHLPQVQEGEDLMSTTRKTLTETGARDMTFTDEELDIIQTSLGVRFCLLETGTAHISYDDTLRMDEGTKKQLGVRMPSREQLEESTKVRKLWERLLHRRSR